MGHILGSKVTNDGKVIFTICMEHEEVCPRKSMPGTRVKVGR